MAIKREIKVALFEQIKKQSNPFGKEDQQEGLIPFLNQIWDLGNMSSTDLRKEYSKDALADIYQHTINNDDWTIDFLFIERLGLFETDELFIKFIEAIVSPNNRENENEIIKFVSLINLYLEKTNLILKISEYNLGGLSIYKVTTNDKNIPIDIKDNIIPFFVEKNPSGRSDFISGHAKPTISPSFVLVFNAGWNDYSVRSIFTLFFYDSLGKCLKIGTTKIIHETEPDTSLILPETFTTLDNSFCSLGIEDSYYTNLKETFDKDFEGIAYALQDAAIFIDIQEKYERNSNFVNSSIRGDAAERRLREIKYKLSGFDFANLYKFEYNFQPIFSTNTIKINFEFNDDKDFPNRIFAIIGKNGTGKTQLISSLPKKISEKEHDNFLPKAPIFSKVIAISYSIFDSFEIPKKTSTFNYVYCGLRDYEGKQLEKNELLIRFNKTCLKIKELDRIEKWKKVLSNFIENEILEEFIILKDDPLSSRNEFDLNLVEFNKINNKFSSGQSIILYIITEIIANIRFDSLLIYDEPETHLHPNAITQLVNTIYELVNEFESYCIIATHSPIIIGELFSKNVFVMEREGTFSSIRRIGLESFGENLTTLTEEVFGNKEIPKQYKKIITELVNSGKTYEEIVNSMEFDNISLSLNALLYIKSTTNN